MRLRSIVVALILALVSIAVAACGGGSGSSGTTASGTSAATTTSESSTSSAGQSSSTEAAVSATFVGADLPDPYYLTMRCGAEEAANDFNINLEWQGVDGVDFSEELTVFNAVVQKGPEAIVLVPFSGTAFIQPAKQAEQDGIKLITADEKLAQPVELTNVRTENKELGGLAAEELVESVGETGQVAVLSFAPEVGVQADRVNGFKSRLAEIAPKLEVVAVEYGGADAGKAAQKIASLLQRYPDLNGVFATDTNDAEGAGSAIKAAGRTGKTKLIAYDASPAEVAGLKSGLFDALVAQDPFEVGYKALKSAAEAVRGTLNVPPAYWQKTGGKVITRENLESPSVAKYLYTEQCS